MVVEALLVALVLVVAVLMAVDLARTPSEMPLGQAGGQGHGTGRDLIQAPGDIGTGEADPEPAGSRMGVAAPEAARFPDRQRSRTGPTPGQGSHGPLRNWTVRSRLLLLAVIPTVTTIAFGIVLVTSSLRRVSTDPLTGSVSHGTIGSALVYGAVVIIVVLLALLLTSVVARSIVEPLRKLQDGALEMTEVLPDAVRRISETDGEGVPFTVRPIGVDSQDEIGVVARAFDQVSEEALRLAANESALRGNVSAIFVNLSRRSQSLVERQISLIDDLEQGEQDAERLANLFKMDHLATRMRRNSENLLVLAGHELFSRGNQPVALVDVIRAAVSEIEEYERVRLDVQQGIMVDGPAVNDVVHTVAELAENATSLSAAGTDVRISGHLLSSGGALIDITDQGVGMSAHELERANWQLENPPLVDVDVSRRMGLFVVGRLAQRYGIRVRLRPAPNGGVTAMVWLPDELIAHESPAAQPRLGGLGAAGTGSLGAEPLWPRGASGMDGNGRRTEQEVIEARAPRFAPLRADGPDEPVNPRQIPSPDPAAAADGEAGIARRETATLGGEALTGTEESSGYGGVIVPPAQGGGEQRLPVFEAVESDWFRRVHKRFGLSATTAEANDGWVSPADDGWRAAETVASPSSSGVTDAGLPKRIPQANLVPGAVTGAPPVDASTRTRPAGDPRSPAATRERFASFQRGVTEGRAAADPGADPGGEDERS